MKEGRNRTQRRRWIGIWFACCSTYGRLWQTRDGAAYAGRCPRCAGVLRVPVGREGTDSRFFLAR